MASSELILKTCCSSCGTSSDLYGSNCRHMTLCPACGKTMAETATPCPDCGIPVTRLIREYNVRAHPQNKQLFVGRFLQGLPMFSKKKGSDSKWSMQREGLQGRQLTDAQREKYKGKPWLLEDDQGQQSFQGMLEGGQQAAYYLLMLHGKDFLATSVGAWYNFHKVAQYKQLTLEEAEEQMKNRRKTADGYQRWMMKAANTGAAAFGEVEKVSGGGGGGGGGRGGFRRRADDEDDPTYSDKGEEDMDDEEDRKNRLGMDKKGGEEEDGEEPAKGDDLDLEDDEAEKGDDWEHEETFTDDDEALANDPDEREDQAPELPAPPEIKQEEEDEEGEQEGGQQENKGGLSESGLELKKLLGKSAGLDESDDESSDDDGDMDKEDISSPVLAPKRKEPVKEEPAEMTPAKPAGVAPGRSTPATTGASKGKRKATADETKSVTPATAKKAKAEPAQEDSKSSLPSSKKEPAGGSSKAGTSPPKVAAASQSRPTSQPSGPVTAEEIKAVLKSMGPAKSHDLVSKFKNRLTTPEDKAAFAAVLKNISRIHKTNAGNFIVLREK